MHKAGLLRPGALQMLSAMLILIGIEVGPVVLAATKPTHEWALVLTGPSALAATAGFVLVGILYAIGFFRYGADKGYSLWLGFWLFLANVPGFVALLLLPERNKPAQVPADETARPYQVHQV